MNWKVVAIIFVVLFLVETAVVGYVMKVGYDSVDRKNECIENCIGFEAFHFNDQDNICYCYKNGEVQDSMYIR